MAFRGILGQDKALAMVQRTLAKGRIPQAYLFSGPSGVGKRLTAMTLAKALNCLAPVEGDSCDGCQPCRKIEKGNHPDVREIGPEGASIKIDQIRELEEDIAKRPYEGKRKVYIFDQAERMGQEAANAFLKTLEEPAGNAVLILVTVNPEALLPTIRSRCQEVKFRPLPVGIVASYLEGMRGMDGKKAWLLASMSGGSLDRALGIREDFLLWDRDPMKLRVFSALMLGEDALLEAADILAKDKEKLRELIEGLLVWCRDLIVYQQTSKGSLLWNRAREAYIHEEVRVLPPGAGVRLYYAVKNALEALEGNANPRLTAEVMLLEMREVLSESRAGKVGVRNG